MADTDEGAVPSEEEDAEVPEQEAAPEDAVVPEDGVEAEVEVDATAETSDVDTAAVNTPDVGRTELKVMRARLTLEEQAEEARRRVLGARRGRYGPATVPAAAVDDDVDLNERLRELVRGVEEETDRLHDDVSRLRSAAGRAGATLQDEIQRAASELSEQTIDELETTVGQTAAESLAALTAAVDSLQETAASLNNVAAGLLTSVEQLAKTAPVAEQLAELAGAPPSIPDALATILSDLTDQLSALGDAVTLQVRSAVEEALATELGRHEARTEHALARIVDEMARLRRRLPVSKKGAPIELTKEQFTAIGQSVGDYLLAAMREQQS